MRRVHLLLLLLSRLFKKVYTKSLSCHKYGFHAGAKYCGMIRELAFPILYFWIWISFLNSAQGH